MNVKNVSIGVLALLAVVFGGLWLVKPYQVVVQQLGVAAGPEHTEQQRFLAGFVDGGGGVATLTQTNGLTANGVDVTAAQFCNNSLIKFSPQTTGASTTLPTGTALRGVCLTQEGQQKTLVIRNTTGTAASTIVIRGNTSSTLMQNQASTSSLATVVSGQAASITAILVDRTAGLILYHVDWYNNQ